MLLLKRWAVFAFFLFVVTFVSYVYTYRGLGHEAVNKMPIYLPIFVVSAHCNIHITYPHVVAIGS